MPISHQHLLTLLLNPITESEHVRSVGSELKRVIYATSRDGNEYCLPIAQVWEAADDTTVSGLRFQEEWGPMRRELVTWVVTTPPGEDKIDTSIPPVPSVSPSASDDIRALVLMQDLTSTINSYIDNEILKDLAEVFTHCVGLRPFSKLGSFLICEMEGDANAICHKPPTELERTVLTKLVKMATQYLIERPIHLMQQTDKASINATSDEEDVTMVDCKQEGWVSDKEVGEAED